MAFTHPLTDIVGNPVQAGDFVRFDQAGSKTIAGFVEALPVATAPNNILVSCFYEAPPGVVGDRTGQNPSLMGNGTDIQYNLDDFTQAIVLWSPRRIGGTQPMTIIPNPYDAATTQPTTINQTVQHLAYPGDIVLFAGSYFKVDAGGVGGIDVARYVGGVAKEFGQTPDGLETIAIGHEGNLPNEPILSRPNALPDVPLFGQINRLATAARKFVDPYARNRPGRRDVPSAITVPDYGLIAVNRP